MAVTRAAVILAALVAAGAARADDDLVARGEYLVYAGGCVTCHTEEADGAVPFAGGRKFESPFGVFYAPNITPDPETGIGGWSDEDFLRAFWEGENPDGDDYYPAFPYTSYTGVTREDLLAIKAYLYSLRPVHKVVPDHDLAWYVSTRHAAGIWKFRYFTAGRFQPDPQQSPEWNRGAYLVRHLGHCGQCHTPRNSSGAFLEGRELAGSAEGPDGGSVPNITPHRDDGIGRWRARDIEYFLDVGMLPDGDFTGGSMSDVIDDSTSKLTREDRLAIAAYLMSLPPLPSATD